MRRTYQRHLQRLTIGSSDRGASSSVSQGGVDDWDKSASFDAGATPRRSTSSLDVADTLAPDCPQNVARVGRDATVGLLVGSMFSDGSARMNAHPTAGIASVGLSVMAGAFLGRWFEEIALLGPLHGLVGSF